MSVVRALVQLLVRVLIGVAAALVLAVLLALVHGGGFVHALGIACLAIGGVALLMSAGGRSTSARTLETGRRIPGLPATLQSQPGYTTLSTSAIFLLTAAVLLVLGALLV